MGLCEGLAAEPYSICTNAAERNETIYTLHGWVYSWETQPVLECIILRTAVLLAYLVVGCRYLLVTYPKRGE